MAVRIDEPAPGAVLEGQLHQARIAGSASADAAAGGLFDVILVIDVSESTLKASGSDIDRDGVIGLDPANELLPPGSFPPEVASTDPQDTVLHAEVLAARTLLSGLDPRRVRAGLVSFAGEVDPTTGKRKRMDQQDAWLEVPLTHDYGQLQRGLAGMQLLLHGERRGIAMHVVEMDGYLQAVVRDAESSQNHHTSWSPPGR